MKRIKCEHVFLCMFILCVLGTFTLFLAIVLNSVVLGAIGALMMTIGSCGAFVCMILQD